MRQTARLFTTTPHKLHSNIKPLKLLSGRLPETHSSWVHQNCLPHCSKLYTGLLI